MSAAATALTLAVRDYINRDPLVMDLIYQSGALAAKLRGKAKRFTGGDKITSHFLNRGPGGGGHRRGANFAPDNVERMVAQRLQHEMKYIRIPVVVNKIDINVLQKGPTAVFSNVEIALKNAGLGMGAYMEIAQFLPGSGNSFGANVNGFAEICNDGSTNSFDGATYANYGDLSRTTYPAIKGKITNVNTFLTNATLDSSYSDTSFGLIEPDLGYTTPKVYSYLRDRYQGQQRAYMTGAESTTLGFKGLGYRNAVLLESRYCPGAYLSGAGDDVAVDFITATTRTEPTPLTAYPTLTKETLWWLTTGEDYLQMYISDDEVFGLGFDEFIPDPDSDMLVGALRLAWQIVCPGPRHQHQLVNIQTE